MIVKIFNFIVFLLFGGVLGGVVGLLGANAASGEDANEFFAISVRAVPICAVIGIVASLYLSRGWWLG